MFTTGKNYRCDLDIIMCLTINRQKKSDWNSTFNSLENIICTLRELIDIKDSFKECNGLINSDLCEFILSLCMG